MAHCFAAGTEITTPSGKTNIEKIKVNDVIITLNENRNRLEKSVVLAIQQHKDQSFFELDFQGSKITVTDDHPFFYKGNFFSLKSNSLYGMQTKTLEVGQRILFLERNKWVERSLTSITPIKKKDTSYTITKLNGNRLFFANNACVSIEAIPMTFAKN